jgi:hypothetical protein
MARLPTAEEVAQILNVSTAWVHDHSDRRQPAITCARLGNAVRFGPYDLRTFIEAMIRRVAQGPGTAVDVPRIRKPLAGADVRTPPAKRWRHRTVLRHSVRGGGRIRGGGGESVRESVKAAQRGHSVARPVAPWRPNSLKTRTKPNELNGGASACHVAGRGFEPRSFGSGCCFLDPSGRLPPGIQPKG